jgi:hypothetical protein
MTERALSSSLRDLYDTLKLFALGGKSLPSEALPVLQKVVLTARLMAEELEDDMALAEKIIASQRHAADPSKGMVLRFRPRPVPTSPDGGNAA